MVAPGHHWRNCALPNYLADSRRCNGLQPDKSLQPPGPDQRKDRRTDEQETKKEIAQAKKDLLEAKAKLKELKSNLGKLSDVTENSEDVQLESKATRS